MVKRFADLLADARKRKRITLRRLSALIGLSPSFLSELEKGGRHPPKNESKIRDLALVLNINEDDLLEAAERERVRRSPKLVERLFNADQDLAWGFCRAAENANEEDLQKAFTKALEYLNEKGGEEN